MVKGRMGSKAEKDTRRFMEDIANVIVDEPRGNKAEL
jgi:hypothetical protein